MTITASTILTARLRLTPLVVDDADAMVTVLGDARMYEFTGGAPLSLDDLRDRYGQLVGGRSADGAELWFNWIVRLDSDGSVVGAMQATVSATGSSAEVAWEVGVAWQRSGFASEAAAGIVEWLVDEGVDQVRASIHPGHHASIKVAAKCGFSPTAETIEGETVWLRTVFR